MSHTWTKRLLILGGYIYRYTPPPSLRPWVVVVVVVVVVVTHGAMNAAAYDFFHDVNRRISEITDDAR